MTEQIVPNFQSTIIYEGGTNKEPVKSQLVIGYGDKSTL